MLRAICFIFLALIGLSLCDLESSLKRRFRILMMGEEIFPMIERDFHLTFTDSEVRLNGLCYETVWSYQLSTENSAEAKVSFSPRGRRSDPEVLDSSCFGHDHNVEFYHDAIENFMSDAKRISMVFYTLKIETKSTTMILKEEWRTVEENLREQRDKMKHFLG